MTREWIPSPNFKKGRTAAIKYIVIHHWDDPAKKPKIQGVVNHFKDPDVEVAAHYVVSGERVIQMVDEKDTAWHSRQANPYTIGIEVDPQVPGKTYETVGALVKEIRGRHGELPLKKHSDFVNTSCPGDLDLARIDKEAKGDTMSKDKLTREEVIRLHKGFTGGSLPGKDYDYRHVGGTLVNCINDFEKLPRTNSTADPAIVEKATRFDKIKSALKEDI